MESKKVIHLELKEPKDGKSDYYFGSLLAIYDSLQKEDVGITYKSLTNALRGKETYENKTCIIRVGRLERKAQTIKNQDRHCSLCSHYWSGNGYMYCRLLKQRITARKRPCSSYTSQIE